MEDSGPLVVIHQPNFDPYLGVFAKYLLADVIVHLDTVQFVKNEFQNRNRILIAGKPAWLTVPVLHSHGQLVRETTINPNEKWKTRHLKTLRQAYSKSPRFDAVYAELEKLYEPDFTSLADWNRSILEWVFGLLNIDAPTRLASEMSVSTARPDERLQRLVREAGGRRYLAGSRGPDYMNRESWQTSGIEVLFLRYDHPTYPQGDRPFVPYCGILDLLFRVDPPEAREIVASGVRIEAWPSSRGIPSRRNLES